MLYIFLQTTKVLFLCNVKRTKGVNYACGFDDLAYPNGSDLRFARVELQISWATDKHQGMKHWQMVRSAGINDEGSQQKPKWEKHKTCAPLQILVFQCEPFTLFKLVSKGKTWPQRARGFWIPDVQCYGQHKVRIKTNTDGWTLGSNEGLFLLNMFELFWMVPVDPFQNHLCISLESLEWATFLFCLACCWQVDWAKHSFWPVLFILLHV